MSSDLEWHVGDDLPEDRGQEGRGRRPRWRHWLALFLVLLFAMGGVHAWWRDRRRTLKEAEAEVQQLARLEFRTLKEGDTELYLSLQDPTDRSWKEAQAAYTDTAGLPLPLQGLTTPITTTVEGARVVGDQARAKILHTATLPSGEEGAFRAVRFYRYTDSGQWLHTKADADYGGHDVVFVSDDLEITMLAHDAIRMDELARQLAELPSRFCSMVPCRRYSFCGIDSTSSPEEARSMVATIGLDTVSLSLAANLEEAADPDDAVLPASFLVGAPANEVAQKAWEATLGEFLVDYLVTREIDTRPADERGGALFEERLRVWLKGKLGVSEPVSPDLDLVRDALDNQAWIPLWGLWDIEPGDSEGPLAAAEIDLLLAFIEEELGSSAMAELFHPLREANSTEQILNHVPWEELLHSVREASGTKQVLHPVPWPARSSVELQFPAYVRERAATATDDLSAFARYELLVGCSEEGQAFRASGLWGWRAGSTEPVLLSAQPPDEGLVPISWSPHGMRLLLRRQSTSYPSFFLLQSASGAIKRLVVPNGATPGYLGPSGWSPNGSRLAYPVFTSQSPGSVDIQTRIVDFETGNEIVLDGQFVDWSPDGSEVLYGQPSGSDTESKGWLSEVAVYDFFVMERDGTALRRIGTGYAAAWSPGGEQIAMITTEETLMAYDLSATRSMTLLDRETLKEALDVTRAVSSVSDRPFRLAWSPDGEWLAMGITQLDAQGQMESTILLVRSGEHRLLQQAFGRISDLSWAPSSQSVRLFAYDGDRFWTSVIGLDGSPLLREESAAVRWSPDDRRLALTRFGEGLRGLEIRDVTSGERWEIDVPGACWPAIWNPRGLGQKPASQP